MEKAVKKYLDYRYPNFFLKRTKFGLAPSMPSDNEFFMFNIVQVASDISKLFSCDGNDASTYVSYWLQTVPIMDNLTNSTIEFLFVSEKKDFSINTTTSTYICE